jgi:hypothetical protein
VTPSVWAGLLAGVALVRSAGGVPVEALAARLGWSAMEVEQVRPVLKRHARVARHLVAPAIASATAAVVVARGEPGVVARCVADPLRFRLAGVGSLCCPRTRPHWATCHMDTNAHI